MLKLFRDDSLPLISIIVPAYNVEKYLEDCIDSICEQTYINIEILLVVTPSDDRTEQIGNSLAEEDERITLLKCGMKGVSNARNIALRVAKGKYIAFVDADDTVEKNYIEVLFSGIQGKEMSLCGFARAKIGSEKPELLGRDKVYSGGHLIVDVLCDNRVGGYLWNKMFCADVIYKYHLSFLPELSIGEDMLFIASYVKYVKKAGYFNRVLYHYRINTDSALQRMYATGVFELEKLSNMRAAYYIGEMYSNDRRKMVQRAVAYRKARTAMWTMFNLLKCDYYDENILKDIKDSLKGNLKCYWTSSNAKFLEKVCAFCISRCPLVFWHIARTILKLVPKKALKTYVNG